MDKNFDRPGFLGRVGAVLSFVAMSGGAPAGAVGEQSEVNLLAIEEIIVTARKQEESGQDVGAAITAFTGERVKELAISNTQDLQTHTPGLMTSEFGSGAGGVFTVRGVGQLDFADHQEQPVAVYADGAYNSFLGGVSFAMYDIERVEVLRGPQATLFGRNATGGVIHVITTKPTREADGYVELRAGEYGEYRGEFGMGGPLGDTLAARFSGLVHKSDGFTKNSLGPDSLEYDNYNARLQLLWEPSDSLDVLVNGRYGRYDNNGQQYTSTRGILDNFASNGGPITGGLNDGLVKVPTAQQYADFCNGFWGWGGAWSPATPDNLNCLGVEISNPNFDNLHDVAIPPLSEQFPGLEDSRSDRTLYGVSSTVNWDINENLQLVWITDWMEIEKQYVDDSDGSALHVLSLFMDDKGSQWSTELRLHGESDAVQWMAGFNYLNIEHDMFAGVESDLIYLSSVSTLTDLETSSYAFFAQGEYAFNSEWSAIVGFRWTEDNKDVFVDSRCTDVPGAEGTCDFFYGNLIVNNTIIDTTRSEGEWAGTFEINWRPDDAWLLYAKYSRGNKAGGFNTGYGGYFTRDVFEFGGEVLTSYEGGFKSTIFDGRAYLNGSVFYYDYEDFHSFFQEGINFAVQPQDAEVLGGELEFMAKPWEGWEFVFGLSLLDAKQLDVDNGVTIRDHAMPYSPDLSFNGLGRYEWPMMAGMISVQVDMGYTDDYTMNAFDSPGLTQDGFALVNARLAWDSDDGRWQADVAVLNIGDKDYLQQAYDSTTGTGGQILAVAGQPRRIFGSVRYNFGR